jgi:hypothetical protein
MGAPSLLPPGIIGDPLLGVSGVQAIIQEFYRYYPLSTAWLQDPLTVAWLTAVLSAAPSLFYIDTSAYTDLAWTVSVEHPSSMIPLVSPWVEDLWWGMEQTMSYHLLLDIVMQFAGGDNKRPRQAFIRHLVQNRWSLHSNYCTCIHLRWQNGLHHLL